MTYQCQESVQCQDTLYCIRGICQGDISEYMTHTTCADNIASLYHIVMNNYYEIYYK